MRLFLFSINSYKSTVESKIYDLTSIPIKIGSVQAGLYGLQPELILKNIKILPTTSTTHTQKPPLQLKQVRLSFDLKKLLTSLDLSASSRLSLIGAELSIIYHKDGSLSVDGLPSNNESEQPTWLLQGEHHEILHSTVTWVNKNRDTPAITFKDIAFSIKNNLEKQTHEIHLTSVLPDQYGKNIRISLLATGDISTFKTLNSTLYIEADHIYFSQSLHNFLHLDLNIADSLTFTPSLGASDVKLWSHWQGSQLNDLSGIMQAKDITLHHKEKNFLLKSLNTEFIATFEEKNWQLAIKHLNIETEKKQWPLTQLNITGNQDFSQLSTSINHLDLHELSELVAFLSPLDIDNQALIEALSLKGSLENITVDIDTKNEHYAAQAHFNNISSNAFNGIPKIENITGTIKGDNAHGQITFNTQQGALFFPDLVKEPFVINQLQGQLAWAQKEKHWLISSESLSFDTQHIQTNTKMQMTIPKDEQPVFMDLQTAFANAPDMSVAPIYYPTRIMSKDSLDWLNNAFISGKITHGGLLLYGELDQYPFLEGQGVFEVLFDVKDMELQFAPDWPHLTQVNTEVLFFKDSLEVNIDNASINNLKIGKTQVTIDSFNISKQLLVNGVVKGSIPDALSFLQHTPLDIGIDDFIESVNAKGNTSVDLDLKIPLVEKAKNEVTGTAHFKNANLTVKSIDLDVKRVTGGLKFTEKGISSNNLKGKALGYPIRVGITSNKKKTSIKVTGKIDAHHLKKQFSSLDYDFIKDNPRNSATPYSFVLDLPATSNPPVIYLESTLLGMPIDFPVPLKKSAQQEKHLALKMVLNEHSHNPLTINYNGQLSAALSIDNDEGSLHSAHIVYGTGNAIQQKQKGINVLIEQASFNASDWYTFIENASSESEGTGLPLNHLNLSTQQFIWNDSQQGNFDLEVQRRQTQWQGSLLSTLGSGNFTIPFTPTAIDKTHVDLDFLNLSGLTKLGAQTEHQHQAKQHKDKNVPPVNLFCKHLLWDKTDLGILKIEAEPVMSGVNFKHIDVLSDNHTINLSANWIRSINKTQLQGDFHSHNFGSFLSQLDINHDIKESTGNIKLSANWQGTPHEFPLSTMNANLNLSLSAGRISSIEPGFGRLLGLIAFEQWGRRLRLDFRDIYKKGLSFNSIKGDFKIQQGKMFTDNLFVDGVPAHILLQGEIDLTAKTINHVIKVTPKSSGAIPIAGTIVGEIAGAITQVFDKDYSDGYFFGSNYQIKGPWRNIKITDLDKNNNLSQKIKSSVSSMETN